MRDKECRRGERRRRTLREVELILVGHSLQVDVPHLRMRHRVDTSRKRLEFVAFLLGDEQAGRHPSS